MLKIHLHWKGHVASINDHSLLMFAYFRETPCHKRDTKAPLKKLLPPVKSTTDNGESKLLTVNIGGKPSPKLPHSHRILMKEKRQYCKFCSNILSPPPSTPDRHLEEVDKQMGFREDLD